MAKYRGTVAWFNNAKGIGFLKRDLGPDVFFHYSAIEPDGFKKYKKLNMGDPVEFDIIQGKQGLQADRIVRTKDGT
jgi:CspA family cold shock protein